MSSDRLRSFFSSVWHLLLGVEDSLQRSLLRLARNARSITLWSAALFMPCAGSYGIAVLFWRPLTPHYWLLCAVLAITAGAVPTLILLVCLRFVPRRFAIWTVALGIVISWMLADWLNYLSLADD
jgi:hypothetical protein